MSYVPGHLRSRSFPKTRNEARKVSGCSQVLFIPKSSGHLQSWQVAHYPTPTHIPSRHLTYLAEFPGEIVRETLLLLLIVDGQRLLLLLQGLDLLQERVADVLFLLLRAGLLQG